MRSSTRLYAELNNVERRIRARGFDQNLDAHKWTPWRCFRCDHRGGMPCVPPSGLSWRLKHGSCNQEDASRRSERRHDREISTAFDCHFLPQKGTLCLWKKYKNQIVCRISANAAPLWGDQLSKTWPLPAHRNSLFDITIWSDCNIIYPSKIITRGRVWAGKVSEVSNQVRFWAKRHKRSTNVDHFCPCFLHTASPFASSCADYIKPHKHTLWKCVRNYLRLATRQPK